MRGAVAVCYHQAVPRHRLIVLALALAGCRGQRGAELPAEPAAETVPFNTVATHALEIPEPPRAEIRQQPAIQRGERLSLAVAFCVDGQGRAVRVTVSRSSGDAALDGLVRQTVERWKFEPFVFNGAPRVVCSEAPFEFGPDDVAPIAADPGPEPVEASPAELAHAPIECARPAGQFGPVEVREEVYDARNGAGARKFSEITTSQEHPLEECGLDQVLARLVTLTCDDGTRPFGDNTGAAHSSRRGNTGSGGRCGSIIDLYDVPCPEGAYNVYADMYFCGP